jgi:hypothetical protein
VSRRVELFGDPGRFTGPATGPERPMLVALLGAQRATLRLKCGGLGTELAVRSVEPSALSLLGLLRHLADVERRWFRRVLAGHDAPARFSSADDADGDFDGAAPDPATVAGAWEAWNDEIAFAERFVAQAPHLDVEGHDGWRARCRCGGCSCTWWRSTRVTTVTPTCCVSGSTAPSGCEDQALAAVGVAGDTPLGHGELLAMSRRRRCRTRPHRT